jgi:FkbM family methyltransferase
MLGCMIKLARPLEGTGIGVWPGIRSLVRMIVRMRLPPDGLVRIDGHCVELHSVDEGITTPIVLTGKHEERETKFIECTVKPGMIVADIGANVGILTLAMARAVGEAGAVYSFEPEPANLALLQRNIERNGYAERVHVVDKAVAESGGSATLYVANHNKGEHSIIDGVVAGSEGVNVQTICLDDFFAEIGARPDFVKIDVQGAEMRVLRGMERMMREGFPQVILAEFWPAGLTSGDESETAVADLLRGHGYEGEPITPMKCGYQNIAWQRR